MIFPFVEKIIKRNPAVQVELNWSAVSLQGLVRKKNEDNMVTPEGLLSLIHTDSEIMSGIVELTDNKPVLAVFDGLGGESGGEYASYLAADYLHKQVKGEAHKLSERSDAGLKSNDMESVNKLIREINSYICDHQEVPRQHMGTTLAMVSFSDGDVICSNVGDSRIYRFSEGKLTQVSKDHVPAGSGIFSNTLTQYLGIDESEFCIEAEINIIPVNTGDIYLICSDGMYKMLSDERMARILNKEMSLTEKIAELREAVLKKGAEDNTTMILCRIEVKEGVSK